MLCEDGVDVSEMIFKRLIGWFLLLKFNWGYLTISSRCAHAKILELILDAL